MIALLLLFAQPSFAFVENVTHGYANCTACHISPSGGGLLNDYGRSLSRELMSTWGWPGSENPFFGAVKNSEHVKIGGDFRYLQTYLENARVKQGLAFLMQRNVEIGVQVGKMNIVATLGTQEGPEGTPRKGEFLSERHYLLWETSDDTRLRVGKFRQNFGIQDPNHTRPTKAALGFGSNSETYNLEFSKFSEDWELFVASSLGRIDQPRIAASERNYLGTFGHYLGGNSKVGMSVLIGESVVSRRHLGGVFAVFPFLGKGLVKAEGDFQRSTAAATPDRAQNLFTGAASLGLQLVKGFTPYLLYEYLQTNLKENQTAQSSPGIGMQWLPLPHLELQTEYKRQTLRNAPGRENHVAWLMVHLYL